MAKRLSDVRDRLGFRGLKVPQKNTKYQVLVQSASLCVCDAKLASSE